MDLITDLALDVIGIFVPEASVVSLIKTVVKIHRNKDFTSEDAGTLLMNLLGIIPGVSVVVCVISTIGHLS